MKIAIAQINCTVGDLINNANKILLAAEQARNSGADLIVTPELALSGYPPKDLLLRKDFCVSCQNTLSDLVKKVHGITLVAGHPHYEKNKLFNAASVIQDGEIITTYFKNTLNQSSYFNETQYFDKGTSPCTFELAGSTFAIAIGTDFWQHSELSYILPDSVKILLVLNASAYQIGKQIKRHQITHQHISISQITVAHTNLIGGQDEHVYDGASFVMRSDGMLTHQLEAFAEDIGIVDFQNHRPIPGKQAIQQSSVAHIYKALCLGIKDYVTKNDFPGVIIGLSGGVDSALTLVIAVDALGKNKVHTVMMPTQYTSDISLHDAEKIATTLGVRHDICNIQPLFDQFLSCLEDQFCFDTKDNHTSLTRENLQARIRGVLLMALSNQSGSLVLTTGNKSELAVGYCTLYGDTAGGFSVLKDVSKTLVYQLCEYRNQLEPVIPQRIIQRAPTAELRLGQTDQDNLPAYEILDPIINAFMEQSLSPDEISAMGYDETEIRRIIQMIRKNEYKRRQSPPGIRITQCDFGTSWHYPITAKYNAG